MTDLAITAQCWRDLEELAERFSAVEGDRLWVRVVMYEGGRAQLTTKQLAALQAAVFGDAPVSREYPEDGGQWDSLYLVGLIPALDSWPPPLRLAAD